MFYLTFVQQQLFFKRATFKYKQKTRRMKKIIKVHEVNPFKGAPAAKSRRQFVKLSGMAVIGTGLLMACSNDDDVSSTDDDMNGDVFDLGSGDVGILNYAYALEQLEADFYSKVVNNMFTGASMEEQQIMEDLYKHEVIHRDFFSAALNSVANENQVLPTLEFDYGNLDWNDRDQVLSTARALEDTGVAAYNGAGKLISNPDYLVVAGKIVSVEARHAAAIRSLIDPFSTYFAGDDIIGSNGLGLAKSPATILAEVGQLGFIQTEFTANNLPTE